MMKIKVLFLITLICMCMTGCSSDLEERRLEMVESNMRVDNIVTAYNQTKGVVESFDYDLEGVLYTDYSEVHSKLFDEEYLSEYFSEDVSYYSEVLTLCGVIQNNDNEFIYQPYHFFNEQTGSIEELVLIKLFGETYFMTAIWENGKIVEFSLDKE